MFAKHIAARLCLVVAAASLAVAAHAQNASPYLNAEEFNLVQFIAPPPASGSAEEAADLAAVEQTQKQASQERVALAQHDADESIYTMFGQLLGPAFTAQRVPATDHLFARLGETESATVDPIKPFYHRVRPYLAAPDHVSALVRPSRSGSYPSGHTTRVTLAGEILASMLPERRAEIWARIREYGQSRIVGGMHYPQDIVAGQMAGSALAGRLFGSAEFRADYAAATRELRTALGL